MVMVMSEKEHIVDPRHKTNIGEAEAIKRGRVKLIQKFVGSTPQNSPLPSNYIAIWP
jgi:hypothetical protein